MSDLNKKCKIAAKKIKILFNDRIYSETNQSDVISNKFKANGEKYFVFLKLFLENNNFFRCINYVHGKDSKDVDVFKKILHENYNHINLIKIEEYLKNKVTDLETIDQIILILNDLIERQSKLKCVIYSHLRNLEVYIEELKLLLKIINNLNIKNNSQKKDFIDNTNKIIILETKIYDELKIYVNNYTNCNIFRIPIDEIYKKQLTSIKKEYGKFLLFKEARENLMNDAANSNKEHIYKQNEVITQPVSQYFQMIKLMNCLSIIFTHNNSKYLDLFSSLDALATKINERLQVVRYKYVLKELKESLNNPRGLSRLIKKSKIGSLLLYKKVNMFYQNFKDDFCILFYEKGLVIFKESETNEIFNLILYKSILKFKIYTEKDVNYLKIVFLKESRNIIIIPFSKAENIYLIVSVIDRYSKHELDKQYYVTKCTNKNTSKIKSESKIKTIHVNTELEEMKKTDKKKSTDEKNVLHLKPKKTSIKEEFIEPKTMFLRDFIDEESRNKTNKEQKSNKKTDRKNRDDMFEEKQASVENKSNVTKNKRESISENNKIVFNKTNIKQKIAVKITLADINVLTTVDEDIDLIEFQKALLAELGKVFCIDKNIEASHLSIEDFVNFGFWIKNNETEYKLNTQKTLEAGICLAKHFGLLHVLIRDIDNIEK